MHLNIFDQTGCHTLIHDKAVDPKQVVGGRDMKTLVGPTMDEILDDDAGEPTQYPFTKTWDEIKRKPLCVLHTSGSTGMPKPIYISHEYTASGAEIQYIPEIDGHMTLLAEYIRVPGRRIYVTFPPFHVGGLIVVGFATIIYANTCNVLGPPHLPPMADVVLDVMKHGNVKCLLTIPAPLMDLSKSKEGMEWMGKLDWIIYGGGKYCHAPSVETLH